MDLGDDSKYLSSSPNGPGRCMINIYFPIQMGSVDGSNYSFSISSSSARYVVNIYSPVPMGSANMF